MAHWFFHFVRKKRIATAEHKTQPVMPFAGTRVHVIGTVFNNGPYVNQKK